MIIARSYGGLGNQLFVYAAIQKIRRGNEKILLVGFEELDEVFQEAGLPSCVIPLRYRTARKKLWRATEIMLFWLTRLLPSRVTVIRPKADSLEFTESLGRMRVSQFRGGYAQSESLIDMRSLGAIFDGLSKRHRKLLMNLGISEGRVRPQKTFFVHIRTKDFKEWPSKDLPAALPASWFLRQTYRLNKLYPHSRFLILSDDPEASKSLSEKIVNSHEVNVPASQALLVMAMCDGGILSPSTFSWQAAIQASRKKGGPWIAPEFWFTWRSREWPENVAPFSADTRSHSDSQVLEYQPVQEDAT